MAGKMKRWITVIAVLVVVGIVGSGVSWFMNGGMEEKSDLAIEQEEALGWETLEGPGDDGTAGGGDGPVADTGEKDVKQSYKVFFGDGQYSSAQGGYSMNPDFNVTYELYIAEKNLEDIKFTLSWPDKTPVAGDSWSLTVTSYPENFSPHFMPGPSVEAEGEFLNDTVLEIQCTNLPKRPTGDVFVDSYSTEEAQGLANERFGHTEGVGTWRVSIDHDRNDAADYMVRNEFVLEMEYTYYNIGIEDPEEA